jgi:hypothetical protein
MSLVGRLEDLALPDIFQIISLSKKTGTLIARSRKGTGMVVFKDGQVVQAACDSIRDSLGNILVSQGMVTEEALSRALALQKREGGKPLGKILVEMGVVPAQTLESVIRKQIEEIVYDLLGWEEGFFNFELNEIALKDQIEIDTQQFLLKSGISAEYLLMEGTRILDEKKKETPRPAQALPKPSLPSRKDFTTLKSMFDELRFPTATAEVTLLILRYASEVVNRAVLFMVKKDEVRGLGQFGMELMGRSADQVVRNIKLPLNQPSLFLSAIESRTSYVGSLEINEMNKYLVNELGGVMPDQVLTIPLIVDNKVALIVYGDNVPERRQIRGVEILEIFMNQAGMALEKALLEKKLAELQKERQ